MAIESVDVRLARIEEHLVHSRGDQKKQETVLAGIAKDVGELKTQRAVDRALDLRGRKVTHSISAALGGLAGFLSHYFHT